MGVVDRARRKLPATGDYLDKDELIRNQEPMGIANVAFDPSHTYSGNPAPRWVLSIIPWFEDQEEPEGLLTFSSNPTRNPMFEDFQAQIEENHNEPIGPVILIKEKSQKGFRFYTLADWVDPTSTEEAQGVPQAAAPALTVVPEPAPARPRPSRAATPAAPEAAKSTEVKPAEVPANDAAPKKRVGRPRKDSATSSTTATSSPSPSDGPVPAQPASKPPATAIDPAVQQIQLSVGKAICPDCHQEVTGRVLPDDSGKRFIIHPHCPATGKAGVVEVTEEV